jgi:SAM-dependent methyltransferase
VLTVDLKAETVNTLPPSGELQDSAPGCTAVDTGLGTTFERWALYRALESLRQEYGFKRVLEAPADGMTGIAGLNSMALALQGCQVTLLLNGEAQAAFAQHVWDLHAPLAQPNILASGEQNDLPFAAGEFDLVWNFNVVNRWPEPEELLAEMARASQRYILFFVPNRFNYGFWLHRLHHQVARQPWDHGPPELLRPDAWQGRLQRLGLRPVRTMWVDCPWWPDIIDLGQMAADFFPFLKRPPMNRVLQRARPESRMRWEAEALPYYRPELYPELHTQMESLAVFENTHRQWLKVRFAHHLGILAVKET